VSKTKQQPTTAMRDSWLVQRLHKPRRFGPFAGNPFSFGGGLRNGGLSDEAMELLGGIFAFDYMGAAEFEFGAVPKTLQGLARDVTLLTAYTITVSLATVPPSWRAKNAPTPSGDATIYVLARRTEAAEVTKRITAWTRKEFPHLKESLRLTSALRPATEYDADTVGWLELSNGFAFFTDRSMWERTCDLFGVKREGTDQ